MKEYQDEKDILDGVEMAEGVVAREEKKKVDWHSPEEVALMRSEERMVERTKMLNKIVGQGRICPCCRKRVWSDTSWVIDKDKMHAVCRSCHHTQDRKWKELHGGDGGVVTGSFVRDVVVRFEFDGWILFTLREKVGVGQEAFAVRCGWSKSYQDQIEHGIMKTLPLEKIEMIISVLIDIGVVVTDTV